jgi:hypothetical protein
VVYEWLDDKGDGDILAQRIDGDGKPIWNAGKAPAVVAASNGAERAAVVVSDGEGGAIVVFEWEDAAGDTDVMAQRISADGEVLWNGGQQAADVASGTALERCPVAVPDGQGGALVAFEFEFPEGEYKGDVDIAAQRISGDGVRLWNGGERSTILSSAPAIERRPVAVADGSGGVIVAFEFEPLEGEHAGDIDILAQRIAGDGSALWNGGEAPQVVSELPGLERAVQGVPMDDGGAVFACEHEFRGGEFGGDIDLLACRVAADGEAVWGDEESARLIASSKWLDRWPLAFADGHNGTIVLYTAIGTEGEWEGDSDLEAVRLSPAGDLVWREGKGPTDVSSGTALERNPAAVILGR